MLAVKFLLLVLSTFVGYLGGYLFTEVWNIGKYKIFDFEGFKCRPCLSFHITWVTATFIALLMLDARMIPVGIFFALMLWLGLKIDQRRKTVDVNSYHLEKDKENV